MSNVLRLDEQQVAQRKAARRGALLNSLISLDGLECSNIILANEALKSGKKLHKHIAQQFEYLAARCEEALEG